MKNFPQPSQDFKADVEIIIRHNTTTGQTQIKTGNAQPINPLFLCQLLTSITKVNLDGLVQAQLQSAKGLPHKFFVLKGETKCRHPYCIEPENADIHRPPTAEACIEWGFGFLATTNHPAICQHCGANVANHPKASVQ